MTPVNSSAHTVQTGSRVLLRLEARRMTYTHVRQRLDAARVAPMLVRMGTDGCLGSAHSARPGIARFLPAASPGREGTRRLLHHTLSLEPRMPPCPRAGWTLGPPCAAATRRTTLARHHVAAKRAAVGSRHSRRRLPPPPTPSALGSRVEEPFQGLWPPEVDRSRVRQGRWSERARTFSAWCEVRLGPWCRIGSRRCGARGGEQICAQLLSPLCWSSGGGPSCPRIDRGSASERPRPRAGGKSGVRAGRKVPPSRAQTEAPCVRLDFPGALSQAPALSSSEVRAGERRLRNVSGRCAEQLPHVRCLGMGACVGVCSVRSLQEVGQGVAHGLPKVGSRGRSELWPTFGAQGQAFDEKVVHPGGLSRRSCL